MGFTLWIICLVHTIYFDTAGIYQSKALGCGKGPNETLLGNIATHVFTKSGNLILMGHSDDVYSHDKDFRRKSGYRKARKQYNPEDPIPYDSFELYSMGYPLICRSYDGKIFTNNSAEKKSFNYFETPDIFVDEYRCITEQNIEEKRTGRLLGRGMPDMFKGTSDKNYLFASLLFDIDENGYFYVTFMADQYIYKFDKDFNLVSKFGYEGSNMDKEYLSVTNPKEIRAKYDEQMDTKGYYTWLEFIDELNYLLRSYHKGGDHIYDGLQIYKDGVLIGDIEVPKGFKPSDYLAPYIYSQAISDYEKNELYLYKAQFKRLEE